MCFFFGSSFCQAPGSLAFVLLRRFFIFFFPLDPPGCGFLFVLDSTGREALMQMIKEDVLAEIENGKKQDEENQAAEQRR